MSIRTLTLLGTLILFTSACGSDPVRRDSSIDLDTVANVEMDRYAGLWYEIAKFPNRFQKDCTQTTATYELLEDGLISVLNQCVKDDGKTKTAKGKARIADPNTRSKLQVKFFPLAPWGDYWILILDDDYRYSVVGDSDGRYLWILAREPQMDETLYGSLVARLSEMGYLVDLLERTMHPSAKSTFKDESGPEKVRLWALALLKSTLATPIEG